MIKLYAVKGNRPDTAVLICGYTSNLNLVLPAVGDYFTFGETDGKRQVVERVFEYKEEDILVYLMY